MPRIGFFLSTEEYTPAELIEQATLAEQAGFEALWISDHFHPWNDAQGQSPMVWAMIGAISRVCGLPVTTAVTCPTVRIHPVVVAQAAATAAVLLDGRFVLGVGSGEALNEHVTGARWPNAELRLAMLEEAVEIIRALWTGDVVSRQGRFYEVDRARLYTLPAEPPPIYVSGLGPEATDLAARIGDGYITTQADTDLLDRFRSVARAGALTQAGFKACFAATRDEAVSLAHSLWSTSGLPGELSQILPSPAHFEQGAALVTPEMTAESMPCGPELDTHVGGFAPYLEAGYDEVYVASVGPHYRDFIEFYGEQVLPAVRG